jgi:hypothetical protein
MGGCAEFIASKETAAAVKEFWAGVGTAKVAAPGGSGSEAFNRLAEVGAVTDGGMSKAVMLAEPFSDLRRLGELVGGLVGVGSPRPTPCKALATLNVA